MKTFYILSTILIAYSHSCFAEPAIGWWQTEEGTSGGYLHVEIHKHGNSYHGTIRKAFDTNGTLVPDYEFIGKTIITGMLQDDQDSYSQGEIWAPDINKTGKGSLKVSGDGLTVHGCLVTGMLCRKQIWRRVEE